VPTFLNLLAKVYAGRFTLPWQGSALPANHPQTACLGVLLPLCHWVLAHGRYSSRKGFSLLDVHLAPEVSGRLGG
jgi:hypothetical protein